MSSSKATASLLVGALLTLLIAAALLADHYRIAPDANWPRASGTVVQREYTYLYGLLKRPRLKIKVEPDGPIVEAVLFVNSSSQIPDNVTFRFNGQPEQEVALDQETSSLVGAALGAALALVGLAFWHFSNSKPTVRS